MQTPHGRAPAQHNVLAVFPNMGAAHHAAEVLERRGIDSGDIGLLGSTADDAVERQDPAPPVRGQVLTLAQGLVVGSLLGALLGAVVGLIFTAIIDDGQLVAGAMFGAVAGVIAGSLVGVAARTYFSDAWQTSLEGISGRVALNVGSEDPAVVERAHKLLERQDPLELIDCDAQDFDEALQRI